MIGIHSKHSALDEKAVAKPQGPFPSLTLFFIYKTKRFISIVLHIIFISIVLHIILLHTHTHIV